jgi:2-phospho-L-lactate/phosphoenolpyruvate guanylyltransferase
MLKDVLYQVRLARGLTCIFVVTEDRKTAAIAASAGARIILETEQKGQTQAVELGLREITRIGIGAALVIPADIPLVHSSDIEEMTTQQILEKGASSSALLAPSHDRLGTNALLLSPPDLIALRFGHDSFSYHTAQVAAQGLAPVIFENDRIGLDIDEPKDLERLIRLGAAGQTAAALASLGMDLRS